MVSYQTPFKELLSRWLDRKSVIFSFCWLSFLVIVALLAPIIANDKPFYFSYDDAYFFPSLSGDEYGVLRDKTTGKIISVNFTNPGKEILQHAFIIHSPIPYSPHKSDLNNADYAGPFDH